MPELLELDYFITSDGVIYPLMDEAGRSLIVGVGGQGLPPVDYITQRGPFQHGSDLLDYRIRDRELRFVMRRQGCNRQDYWDIRAAIGDIFRPNRQVDPELIVPAVLRKILPNGAVRDIRVMPLSGPGFRPSAPEFWDEWAIEEEMALIAHDPFWFDPELVTVDLLYSGFEEYLVLPFKLPFALNVEGYFEASRDVVYPGTWPAYPTIYIDGPLASIEIRNNTSNEVIRISYALAAGERLTVNLNYGVKSVVSSQIGPIAAEPDSDLATWHIAQNPEATGGSNDISVLGGGADANTAVFLTYEVRYIMI